MYLSLENNVVNEFKNILTNADHLFKDHHLYGANPLALDKNLQGKSIWLHLQNINKDGFLKHPDLLIPIIEFIRTFRNSYFPDSNLGRSYIHRLLPGQLVDRHIDFNHKPYFDIVYRYQIFFDIPAAVEIESVPKPQENSLFFFNHKEYHSYNNKSDKPFYFIVFDLFGKN